MRTLDMFGIAATIAAVSGAVVVASCVDANWASDCNRTATCPPEGGGGSGGGLDGSVGGGGADSGSSTSGSCEPGSSAKAVDDACGVFVSADSGDDATGKGTKEAPLKTIGAALKKGATVYVCAGSAAYSETVVLSAKTTLYGGLDCSTWKYDAAKKTRLTAVADAVPLRLTNAAQGSTVDDFAIGAADSSLAGGSSIAVVADGVTASFVRCDLSAGKASAGAVGTDGSTTPAQGGTDGNAGGDACSANPVNGAPQVKTVCGTVNSVGGNGGVGTDSNGGAGSQGLPDLSDPDAGVMGGKAGNGDTGASGWTCAGNGGVGGLGLSGASGAEGPGALSTAFGQLTSTGFVGASGSDGQAGSPGQGGGGGGGVTGNAGACSAAGLPSSGGASGGSGGSGGCGGQGGGGGKGGGASISLVSLNATLTLTDVTLKASDGVSGGRGGNLQAGGLAGSGGAGGKAAAGLNAGCDGGKGGPGGNGGPGGGGRGGHSIGMAVTGTAPTIDAKQITMGAAGKGGLGGNGNLKSNAGADGVSASCWDFDKNQSCLP